MPFSQLLYVSKATTEVTPEVVSSILEASRRNNAALGVTGLLMFSGNLFIQILEGERDVVEELVRRIQRDPRHRSVMVMLRREIRRRSFPDWSMGCRELDPALEGDATVFRMSREALRSKTVGGEAAIIDLVCGFGGAGFVAAD